MSNKTKKKISCTGRRQKYGKKVDSQEQRSSQRILYLLDLLSISVSRREKLDRTVQEESDMIHGGPHDRPSTAHIKLWSIPGMVESPGTVWTGRQDSSCRLHCSVSISRGAASCESEVTSPLILSSHDRVNIRGCTRGGGASPAAARCDTVTQ